MRRRLLALAALAILVLACSGVGAPTSTSAELRGSDGLGAPGFAGATAAPVGPARAASDAANSVAVPLAFDPTRMLVLTANIAMKAKDPWSSSDRAQAIAIGLGGDVMGLSQSGSGDQRSANLVLRVPSARFNDALRQLRDLPDTEVASSSVDGKDVTDQFVDLEARLRAKHAEEQRYIALLARAEKIDDILRIDQALASVRTQIEQLTGQVNSLKGRTEFSTITVAITPAGIVPVTTSPAYDPSRTLERALASLAAMLRVLTDVVIWALVFGWIPLAALGVYVAAQRTRRVATGPTS